MWKLVTVAVQGGKRYRRYYAHDDGRRYALVDRYERCMRPHTLVYRWHLFDESCLPTLGNVKIDYGKLVYEAVPGGEAVDFVILEGL